MKLLFVLLDLPYPATNGSRWKVQTILDYMAPRHDCDVLAIGSQSDLARCEPWLKRFPRLRVLGVFAPDPGRFLRVRQAVALLGGAIASSLRFRSHALEMALVKAVSQRKYDVVHVDKLAMAGYCTRLCAGKSVLSVDDARSFALFGTARDRFASFTVRLGALVQGLLQRRVDRTLFQMADAVHFVNRDEADWCRTRLGARNAVHTPLAVHSDFLRVVPSADARRGQTLVLVERLGADDHRKAVERFLAAHWLGLRRKHPNIRLVVVGGSGMRASFRKFVAGLPGVELHEWVDRLEEVLAEAGIAVFPHAGVGGMKNRVLQCMAAGNAVVGTPNSFSGLAVRNGVEALIAGTHADLATAIETLLADPGLSRDIGSRARQFIQDRFTFEAIGRAWEQLYMDVAAGAPVRSSYGESDAGRGARGV